MDASYKMSKGAELSWELVTDIQILNIFWIRNTYNNIKVKILVSV